MSRFLAKCTHAHITLSTTEKAFKSRPHCCRNSHYSPNNNPNHTPRKTVLHILNENPLNPPPHKVSTNIPLLASHQLSLSLWHPPLAVASAEWEFLAVLPLFDPPRHDTRDTVATCLIKGIAVKMITGDQLAIGQETARQLGMGDGMHTSHELVEVGERGRGRKRL